jgi:hypothetical protein
LRKWLNPPDILTPDNYLIPTVLPVSNTVLSLPILSVFTMRFTTWENVFVISFAVLLSLAPTANAAAELRVFFTIPSFANTTSYGGGVVKEVQW